MANPICTIATLVTNGAQFQNEFVSPSTRVALTVYAKVLELKAIGGTDYLAVLNTTLAQDAATLFNGFNYTQIQVANLAIAFQNATAAGATVPAGIDDKLEVIKCLLQQDPDMLAKMDALLNCQLGVHKAYPQ
jgi:hypothetical protein